MKHAVLAPDWAWAVAEVRARYDGLHSVVVEAIDEITALAQDRANAMSEP